MVIKEVYMSKKTKQQTQGNQNPAYLLARKRYDLAKDRQENDKINCMPKYKSAYEKGIKDCNKDITECPYKILAYAETWRDGWHQANVDKAIKNGGKGWYKVKPPQQPTGFIFETVILRRSDLHDIN